MQTFDIKYAQEHFDELVALVDAGEYVEITRPNGKAIVLLTEAEYLRLRTEALAAIGPAMDDKSFDDGQRLSPVNVCFDDDMMRVELSDGQIISVQLAAFPRLLVATPEQRADFELSPCGIHWWPLDENISVAGLLIGNH